MATRWSTLRQLRRSYRRSSEHCLFSAADSAVGATDVHGRGGGGGGILEQLIMLNEIVVDARLFKFS